MPTIKEYMIGQDYQPTSGRAKLLADRVADVYGMDPSAQRLSVLPYPSGALAGQEGPVDWSNWTAPQWVYDAAKASLLPGHVAQGGAYDYGDVTNMALFVAGGGYGSGAMGGVPSGSLGMGGGRLVADKAEEIVKALTDAGLKAKVNHWSSAGGKSSYIDVKGDASVFRPIRVSDHGVGPKKWDEFSAMIGPDDEYSDIIRMMVEQDAINARKKMISSQSAKEDLNTEMLDAAGLGHLSGKARKNAIKMLKRKNK